jgi:anti-anti-sigma factor
MALTLYVCPADHRTLIRAAGDVDLNAAEPFQDMMLEVMRGHGPLLLLDLSGVAFMDCAGLHALLLTRRRAALRGGSLSLIAESLAVRRIIDILGVRDVLPVCERLRELSGALLNLLSWPELPRYQCVERPVVHQPAPAAGR